MRNQVYKLSQLRYDLGKLRAKGLVEKVPRSQRYRLTPEGYRVCVLFLKLVQRVYAPLVAGALEPAPHGQRLPKNHRCQLDRLYTSVDQALTRLVQHLGLATAA